MNTTLIANRTQTETAVDTRLAPARFVLPARFDVHQIDMVRTELAEQASSSPVVEVDGSLVEMIDLPSLALLDDLMSTHPGLRLSDPSVALRATIDLAGHSPLAAAISFDPPVDRPETDRIMLTGKLDPAESFELRDTLEPLTSRLRPSVVVDLADVTDLHPSVVSVLVRHRRQANRQGGDLHLIRPVAAEACTTLDHIGLVDAAR